MNRPPQFMPRWLFIQASLLATCIGMLLANCEWQSNDLMWVNDAVLFTISGSFVGAFWNQFKLGATFGFVHVILVYLLGDTLLMFFDLDFRSNALFWGSYIVRLTLSGAFLGFVWYRFKLGATVGFANGILFVASRIICPLQQ